MIRFCEGVMKGALNPRVASALVQQSCRDEYLYLRSANELELPRAPLGATPMPPINGLGEFTGRNLFYRYFVPAGLPN